MPLSVPPALGPFVAVVLAVALMGLHPLQQAHAIPIEGYPAHQPQTKCSPRAKPGTVMLSEYLLRKYPGSSSSGISRDCGASGLSEHKEGRALDWGLDARSDRDRGYAEDLIRRLLAADRRGNPAALARRMGVMYLIWNDRIWSASSGYRERRYLHSACVKVQGCSVTLRHRDHMHISLSWAGARAKTSWYVRRTSPRPPAGPTPVAHPAPAAEPRPKPESRPEPEPESRPKPRPKPEPSAPARPAPEPRPQPVQIPKRAPKLPGGVLDLRRAPYTRVVVPADGEIVETRFKLAAGVTYSVTAAGLYTFGGPSEVGDAVCTWSRRDEDWLPSPRRGVKRRYGRLALVVNGKRLFGDHCRDSHTYRAEITPGRDRTLKLRVAGKHRDSHGRLTVVVGRKRARVAPALPQFPTLVTAPTYSTTPRQGNGLLSETVRVQAANRGATYTRGSLEPNALYRVTVSGLVGLGGGVRSNGQCLYLRGQWYDAASIDPRVPGQDHGNLYVDGDAFRGEPVAGGCAGNVHVGDMVADTRGRMRLDLWDPHDVGDNTGALDVLVQRVTPVRAPGAAHRERPRPRRTEWRQRRDEMTVRADRGRGAVSAMHLRKGERVQVRVAGRYTSGRTTADASCVRTPDGWLPRDPTVLGQDVLDVWVDGQPVSWRASGDGPCSGEATYLARFTALKPGPVRVAVFDLDHRDNAGSLDVSLRRLGR